MDEEQLEKLLKKVKSTDEFIEYPLHVPEFFDGEIFINWYAHHNKKLLSDFAKLLLSFGKDERTELQRHLVTNYRQNIETTDGLIYVEAAGGSPLEKDDDIWRLMYSPVFSVRETENAAYLIMDCEVMWEGEHGLCAAWKDGKTLWHMSNNAEQCYPEDKEVVGEFGHIIHDGFGHKYRTYANEVPEDRRKEVYDQYYQLEYGGSTSIFGRLGNKIKKLFPE